MHWRSSARYGELRVRELELLTGGQELVIGLDSGLDWRSTPQDTTPESFEQAVSAAASLYFYAQSHSLNVQLWTTQTGLVHGNTAVLETLADTYTGAAPGAELPNLPIVWLTANPASLNSLPPGSRWLLWSAESDKLDDLDRQTQPSPQALFGILINSLQPLITQLQSDPPSPSAP